MFSDVPYWRPPKARSVWSFSWSLMVSKSVCSEVPVKPTTRNLQANEFRHRALEAVFSMAVARMIEDHRIGSHATGRPAFSNEKLE